MSPVALLEVGFHFAEIAALACYDDPGCDESAGTGYRGRAALYEVLPIDDDDDSSKNSVLQR